MSVEFDSSSGHTPMTKVRNELYLLLSLVLIAALLNFLVSSQRVVLCFFFLPTLYSADHFGRRHATLTAFASVAMVGLWPTTSTTWGRARRRRFPLPNSASCFPLTATRPPMRRTSWAERTKRGGSR